MNPPIPLSPQQQKKRRTNLLFVCLSVGVCAGVLSYLFFWPREEQPRAATAPAPPHSQMADETGEPAATTETTPQPTAPAGVPSPELTSSVSLQPGAAGENHSAEYAYSADADTPEDETQLSEEELAKLPPWQAAFARLSAEQRLTYATAFAKAKAAYGREQWASCLALLDDCELTYNGSPNVWNLRACVLLATDELDAAEANIRRSLDLNPEDTVALMCQSELLMLRRDFRGSITILEKLRQLHTPAKAPMLHAAFTFHQLLCHLMLRQEMEARALVADLTPLSDSPLYYFSQAAFCVYKGDSNAALSPIRSATTIYGQAATTSYRKWMGKCGLADKYVRGKRR